MKRIVTFLLLVVSSLLVNAQGVFSIATDLSLLRSIGKHQGFWAVGQNVRGDFQMTERTSAYALVNYYTNGRVHSTSTALTKDFSTVPFAFTYDATSLIRYRQISLGLKRYIKGQYNSEEGIGIYGFGGFGLLFGNVETTTSLPLDTAHYYAQPIAGKGSFKRLTVDLGIGAEVRIGSSIYLYTELRTWFPASSYPSPFLYYNDLPRVITSNTGLRLLID